MPADAPRIDLTHDPALRSWVESANDPASPYPIQNLPWVRVEEREPDFDEMEGEELGSIPRSGLATVIGDMCVFMEDLIDAGFFDNAPDPVAIDLLATESEMGEGPTLDRATARYMRRRLVEGLRTGTRLPDPAREMLESAMTPLEEVTLLKPAYTRNYTDFYASVHHASTVGAMFRPDNPLLPNYKHVPIGYHGRASSIVLTGTPVRRPLGQQSPPDSNPAAGPTFGPCTMLDYELEVGCVIGVHNALGEPVPIARARDHILGLCLVNDWSARDIQKWEYQPLGPFLAKNFATTVSAAIITLDALEPFRIPAYQRPAGDPAPLAYLNDADDAAWGGFDLTLEVFLQSAEMARRGLSPVRVSGGRAFRDMYWTFAQMVAHHTSNGCNLQAGDLLASGTVSGPAADSRGCLLELTWDGPGRPRKPLELPSGEKRTFLADGDTVILRAYCERDGYRRIDFGECRGTIVPATA
jgi:fumarylacetoacetase